MDKIRLLSPVFHGDTLYAYTEVLEKSEGDRTDAGVVRFRHYGVNQDDNLCVDAERTVLPVCCRGGARGPTLSD